MTDGEQQATRVYQSGNSVPIEDIYWDALVEEGTWSSTECREAPLGGTVFIERPADPHNPMCPNRLCPFLDGYRL